MRVSHEQTAPVTPLRALDRLQAFLAGRPPGRGASHLTLRALHQSERFERAWKLLSSTLQRTVEIPENVVLFPKRAVH